MAKNIVGAGIVSIITESLYDKPIVVFREYIQNSADSLERAASDVGADNLSAQFWMADDDLLFMDNGTGIAVDRFQDTMTSIANSSKKMSENIGYKGIGRLSGISYCRSLSFINIIDFRNQVFQEYRIDCDKYRGIQKSDLYQDMDFDKLMEQIGALVETPDNTSIVDIVDKHRDLFVKRNTGFLVVMKEITAVLRGVIDDEQFVDHLGWLLPVPFLPELTTPSTDSTENYLLFNELTQPNPLDNGSSIPAKSYNICFDGEAIFRPLKNDMIRTYLCRTNLEQYAIGVHTFSNKKIEIDRKNPFSGIRIYIDNMLLCDENELIPALQQYGLIRQGSTYEVIQSVRGIGAMIFITDKVNITANARRTFIDVTDEDSFRFLELIGEFVDSIFKARYALSGYESAKRKTDIEKEKLNSIKETALQSLGALARSDIKLKVEENPEPVEFSSLSKTEQKRIVKSKINKELNSQIKNYLSQTEEYNLETCYSDFKTWLSAN